LIEDMEVKSEERIIGVHDNICIIHYPFENLCIK